MLRKLLAVLAAIAVTTGLTMAVTSGADAKSTLPAHGSYSGVDHAGRMVTFSFSGNSMSHFTVGHKVIGGAHVGSGAAWHETCHGGFCTKGMWVTDTHVTGSWREGGGTWTHFSAYAHPPMTIQPYTGSYMGRDHTGLKIHLSFSHGRINSFTLDHSNRGNIPVTNGKFETCLQSVCVKGHWQSEYEVVGSIRPVNSSHWVTWDAYAYAA
jgi:hypothetical protein